jgi:anti-sigma regulatory factor (Ser/Thr protein kinase)
MDDQVADRPTRSVAWFLDGLGGTVAEARDRTQEFLVDARITPPPLNETTVGDALLLVSELVSNAVRHAPGPCTLELADDGRQVTIAVSDTSTSVPLPRAPDYVAGGGGFGWHLLHRVALRIEIALRAQHGKTVSAILPTG